LFRRITAQRLLLEYDDARSGSFEPLRDVPDDKFVVLGLVTTKNAYLESMESLTKHIGEAARYVSKDRLGLSPQCGFASSIVGNRISSLDQTRKLELVVNAAGHIWP
jgi:methionine synthase II (cobalamin-independent)